MSETAKVDEYDALLAEMINFTPESHRDPRLEPAQNEICKRLMALSVEQKTCAVRAICRAVRGKQPEYSPGRINVANCLIGALLSRLLRKGVFLDEADTLTILQCSAISRATGLHAVELFQQTLAATPAIRTELQKLRNWALTTEYRPPGFETEPNKERLAFAARIDSILYGQQQAIRLNVTEPWAAAARDDIRAIAPERVPAWNVLQLHLQTATSSKPSAAWMTKAEKLINGFDRKGYRYFATSWLSAAQKQNQMFCNDSQIVLRGIVWAASVLKDAEVAEVLGDLGEACWKKIPGHGPTCQVVGNAVFWALSSMGTDDAIAQLTRINSKLKHASARTLAARAMDRLSDATGKSREDLEEIGLPTFGLSAAGEALQTVGSFTMTLALTPAFEAELRFADSTGKFRKSVPSQIKSEHAAALRAAKKTLKRLQGLLPAQKVRVEAILRNPDRSWSLADWRARYQDHPLMAPLTRRLIWRFSSAKKVQTGMPVEGKLLAADDTEFLPDSAARVQLWHPCTDSVEGVRAWRAFLERHQVTQPFKQAHREIYLVTDAERGTATYSNRFAAHIVRQFQMHALCAARGWSFRLQGGWDSGGHTPTLQLTGNLKAEFWVDVAGIGDEPAVGPTGVALYLATDKVEFVRQGSQERVEMDNVPPQIFSEVMRDVDLFIGVCSVANDPGWTDGGPTGRFGTYWQNFSFGELGASAQTRREILKQLLPRLAIHPQCSISDKFLIVRGALRTYKIHLGSGNILMEPNDQYLCIVADRREPSPGIHLPFEGDTIMAVILSKAILLANDQRIKDPTITGQILQR